MASGFMNATEIAKVCHEVNRAYCQALGDDSQPTWEAAPQWLKDGILRGVHFHLDNPDATPRQSHEKWFEDRRANGWRFAPEKNAQLKEHPNLVEFDELPPEQRAKDYLFRAVVHSLRPARWDGKPRE